MRASEAGRYQNPSAEADVRDPRYAALRPPEALARRKDADLRARVLCGAPPAPPPPPPREVAGVSARRAPPRDWLPLQSASQPGSPQRPRWLCEA